MEKREPERIVHVEYSSSWVRLNLFQRWSVFVSRLFGLGLLFKAADGFTNVVISRSRGYSVSWYYACDPGAKYLVLGLLCLVLARPFGAWLGSGLGSDTAK